MRSGRTIHMEKVSIGDVEPNAFGSDIDRRGLSDPLETTDIALTRVQSVAVEREIRCPERVREPSSVDITSKRIRSDVTDGDFLHMYGSTAPH